MYYYWFWREDKNAQKVLQTNQNQEIEV